MHARAARDREKKGERGMEGMDGGNGIQLTFLHSGELLRPQAVHTRPSCVSFRRCYEPKGYINWSATAPKGKTRAANPIG